MNESEVVLGDEARERLIVGLNTLSDVVEVTFGPRGGYVALSELGRNPRWTRDGVTVTHAIVMEDKLANSAIQIALQAADKTRELVGDGTTTTIALMRAMVREAYRCIVVGQDTNRVCQGMGLAVNVDVAYMGGQAISCTTDEDMFMVVAVATHGDTELARLITDAVRRVGQEGVIRFEPGRARISELSVQDGLRLRGGYASSAFTTDAQISKARVEHPLLVIRDTEFNDLTALFAAMEVGMREERPLVLIGPGFSKPVLATLFANRHEQGLCPIKINSVDESVKNLIDDLAHCSGARILGRIPDDDVRSFSFSDLGQALWVEATHDETLIMLGDSGQSEGRATRLSRLEQALDDETDNDSKDQVRERIAMLDRGIAIISIGADSAFEMSERQLRAHNGLQAVRAAMRGGLVPGGGVAALRTACHLSQEGITTDESINAGVRSVIASLKIPARRILANAGIEPEPVLERIASGEVFYGYDVTRRSYGDLRLLEVLDPALVTATALRNACSAAIALIKSEGVCIAADKG